MKFTFEHVTKYKWINHNKTEKQRITVLDDVSFESCGDEIHVILGPSGSGKTTLLRLLNKLESIDSGRILVDDIDINGIPPRQLRKDIGMVFQTPALFKGTIEQNILFGPQLNNSDFSRLNIEQLMHVVGLDNIEPSRDVENLSLGQQQRISFARTLANKPKVLLLDEPTSALDPTAANNLLDIVKKINDELEIDVIMVTHIMHHAQRIAESVCLLADGKIIEYGLAKEFFEQPRTDIGRKFIRGEL